MTRRPQQTFWKVSGLTKGSWSTFDFNFASYDDAEKARLQWSKKYPSTKFIVEPQD